MLEYEYANQAFKQYLQAYDMNHNRIALKVRHTYGVVKMSQYIAKELGLCCEQIELARIIALLHDIGRFEQAKLYNDLRDYRNIDHAKMGTMILFEEGKICNFVEQRKYDRMIQKAILNHNKFKIEEGLAEDVLLQAKLIRDADKVDNFRVKIQEKIENIMDSDTKDKIEDECISDAIFEDFMEHKTIVSSKRKTKMDNWVSYIAFLFDINFTPGLQYVMENDYINKAVDRIDYHVAETKQRMEQIRKVASSYVEKKLQEKIKKY